jgi:tetratricopeptide (TPR) repeat protein
LKRYSKACEAYTHAIQILEKDNTQKKVLLQTQLKRALALFYDKNYAESLSDLQSVVRFSKGCSKAHFYIGKILNKGIENDKAKKKDAILHFE